MGIKYNGKNIKALYYGEQEIVKRIVNDKIIYQKEKPKPRANAFRFKNVSDKPNILKLKKHGNAPQITLEKSSNGIEYVPCDIYAGITLQPNETIYLRGNNKTFANNTHSDFNSFSTSNVFYDIEAAGSVMDLCDGGKNTKVCDTEFQFGCLFYDMIHLIKAPELPATTLSPNCYSRMFVGCEYLTEAPILPAIQLTPYCYEGMFWKCSYLTKAPELPATTLTESCYFGMFDECVRLNYIKIGATSWNTSISNWLNKVSKNGIFIKPKDLVIWNGVGTQPDGSIRLDSPHGIPQGWTIQDI